MNTQTINQSPTFIHLKNQLFGSYNFIFKINDSYSINEISKLKSKHQFLFQKIENKNQQLNLIYVDSVFANILADLTLEVLLKKVHSFQGYIDSKFKIKLVEPEDEIRYFTYKFSDFIHLLLYSDIAANKIYTDEIYTDRVFCLKENNQDIEFFSIYEQQELKNRLLNEMKLEIDFSLSSISENEANICLKIKS
ncbi:MAG: HpaII family restriction endonuclease [Bacteroidota bacterium]